MASLRAMMGRAARRVLSEKVRVFLCGPSPNPARASAAGSASQAAVASASQEAAAAQLTKFSIKSDALRKRVSTSRYPRRPTRMMKKADSSKAVFRFIDSILPSHRFMFTTLLTLAFLEGYNVSKEDDQKLQEGLRRAE